MCICSLRHPECNATFCGLICPTIFVHIISKMPQNLKKVTEYKMCVLIFSTNFVQNISHSKKKWARYDKKKYIGLHVKYRLFLSDFNETCIFSTDFSINTQISNFMKIRPVAAESFHAGRQTDGLVPCTIETLVRNLLLQSYFLFFLSSWRLLFVQPFFTCVLSP
jgi:hypothetical protein